MSVDPLILPNSAIVQPLYEFEGFTLDVIRGCLKAGDREIDLRPKSFEFLCYLVEHADRLVSKDEIMKAVWPNVLVTDDSLKRCLSDIRLALRDDAQRIIKTVPRRGYRFVAAGVSADGGHGHSGSSSEQIAGLQHRFRPGYRSWCFRSQISAVIRIRSTLRMG